MIVQDYGMSWDEHRSRINGIVSLNYIAEMFNIPIKEHFGKITPLNAYFDKDYGVALELPLAYMEYLFTLEGKNIFFVRHFFTYLIFLFGAYSVYDMSSRRFKNWQIGLLSALLFILSPRIFAEAFYNDKDIVFMAAFTVAVNYNIKFILNPTIISALLASFFLAFSIDIRIMGIILFLVILFVFIKNSIVSKAFLQNTYISMLAYTLFLSLFIVAMWPWLWADPIGNFLLAFENMSKFRWDGSVLLAGDFIKANQLPWYYTLTWITITTPPLYIILFLVGSFMILKNIISNHVKFWTNSDEMQDYIFLGLFYLPILSVILLKSTLYDGWRQTYFVYPMFILLATLGIVSIWRMKIKLIKQIRTIFLLIMIGSIGATALMIYKMHPFQNVYFNFLAGSNLKKNWELDYWGLSNRKAMEYILKHDSQKKIVICPISSTPLAKTLIMLDKGDKKRITILHRRTRGKGADYLINNFRGVRDHDKLEKYFSKDFELYHSIKVEDVVILTIYKRK